MNEKDYPSEEYRSSYTRRKFIRFGFGRATKIGGISIMLFSAVAKRGEAIYCPTDTHTCDVHTCSPGPTHVCGPDTCNTLDECSQGFNNFCNNLDKCETKDKCDGFDNCYNQDSCPYEDLCNSDWCWSKNTGIWVVCSGRHECPVHDTCFSHYCSREDVCINVHECEVDNCFKGKHSCSNIDLCGSVDAY